MRKFWPDYDEIFLYVATYKIVGEGQGNTWINYGTDIHMDIIVQKGGPLVIETTHSIGLGFGWIRIYSNF